VGPHLEAAPPGVSGSSLQFTNYFYPDAASLEGVRVVCACGNAIHGRKLWGSNDSAAGASSDGSSSSSSASPGLILAFDFLPQDPTSPLTAATLLSGGFVPGGSPACLPARPPACLGYCGQSWHGLHVGVGCFCSLPGQQSMPLPCHIDGQAQLSGSCKQPRTLGGPPGCAAGAARCRQLRAVPRQRCQLQGLTWLADPSAAAASFQHQYDLQLRLLHNDCTHHASQLVALLLREGTGPSSRAVGAEPWQQRQ